MTIPTQRRDPDRDETRALVAAAQAGDHDAFARLYTLHRPQVYRIIRARINNHHHAEDLTADTFEKAWRNLPRFRWQGAGFGGWLTVIAINRCHDFAKSGRQRMETLAGDDHLTASTHPDSDRRGQPEHVALANADTEQLDKALAVLTVPQRRALAARFGHDLPVIEAAEALGCGVSALKTMQHRATRALRQQLGGAA